MYHITINGVPFCMSQAYDGKQYAEMWDACMVLGLKGVSCGARTWLEAKKIASVVQVCNETWKVVIVNKACPTIEEQQLG